MNWFSIMIPLLSAKKFQLGSNTWTNLTISKARRSRTNRNFHFWLMMNSIIMQICHSKNKSLQISTQLSSIWITRTKTPPQWCKRLLLLPTSFSTRRHLIFIIRLSTCCSRLLEPWTLKLHHALLKWPTFSIRWAISCKPSSFRPNLSSFKRRLQDMTTLNWLTVTPILVCTTTSADTGQRASNTWTVPRTSYR